MALTVGKLIAALEALGEPGLEVCALGPNDDAAFVIEGGWPRDDGPDRYLILSGRVGASFEGGF